MPVSLDGKFLQDLSCARSFGHLLANERQSVHGARFRLFCFERARKNYQTIANTHAHRKRNLIAFQIRCILSKATVEVNSFI